MLTGLAWGTDGNVEGIDLTFSEGVLDQQKILDSSTSPPARYLIEIGRRLLQMKPDATFLAIANPLLPTNLYQLSGWLNNIAPSQTIIADGNNFPLIYILPRHAITEYERFLLTLSVVDARIDGYLLGLILGKDIRSQTIANFRIGTYPISTSTGWFQGPVRQDILRLLANRAINTISQSKSWRNLPLAVYHPYHAGSIVFFAAGAHACQNSLFQRHVICSTYRDIVAATDHPLEPIWLKLPWLPRDNSVGEPHYFAAALDRLGEDFLHENFLVFMRYSRSTGHSPFHRIDHDRFSLGDSIDKNGQTCQEQPPGKLEKCSNPSDPLRLLFHVTGGVAIKNYPFEYCKTAIRTLSALGIKITVIGRPDLEAYGAISIEADETDQLINAVREHHIFVGLDSFPHHFVKNAMKWPTIGLFGATKSANFGGGWHDHYRSLDASLPCHPCGAEKNCPILGYKECSNYTKPLQLVTAILEMAQRVYNFTI